MHRCRMGPAIQLATKCQPSLCVRYAEKCVRSATFARHSHFSSGAESHPLWRATDLLFVYLLYCLRSAFSSLKRRTSNSIHIMWAHQPDTATYSKSSSNNRYLLSRLPVHRASTHHTMSKHTPNVAWLAQNKNV